jgi:hypothetical protein
MGSRPTGEPPFVYENTLVLLYILTHKHMVFLIALKFLRRGILHINKFDHILYLKLATTIGKVE